MAPRAPKLEVVMIGIKTHTILGTQIQVHTPIILDHNPIDELIKTLQEASEGIEAPFLDTYASYDGDIECYVNGYREMTQDELDTVAAYKQKRKTEAKQAKDKRVSEEKKLYQKLKEKYGD